MNVLLPLVLISLAVAGAFLVAFFWAVNDGQYDDECTPSMRILVEDDVISTISQDSNRETTGK